MKHVPIQFESLISSRKIPVESFPWSRNLNLYSICLSYGLKLGGHVPRIESPWWGHAYFFKHSLFPFQDCVKIKPFPFYLSNRSSLMSLLNINFPFLWLINYWMNYMEKFILPSWIFRISSNYNEGWRYSKNLISNS